MTPNMNKNKTDSNYKYLYSSWDHSMWQVDAFYVPRQKVYTNFSKNGVHVKLYNN